MAVAYPARSKRWTNVSWTSGNESTIQYIKSNKWVCDYCASMNLDSNLDCRNCGAPRAEPEGFMLVGGVEHHPVNITLRPGLDFAEFERLCKSGATRALSQCFRYS